MSHITTQNNVFFIINNETETGRVDMNQHGGPNKKRNYEASQVND